MKEKWVTAALMQLIKVLTGSGLLKEVMQLVTALINKDELSGVYKKQHVTNELNDVKNEFYNIVQTLSGWLVSAAIDIAYAYLAARR